MGRHRKGDAPLSKSEDDAGGSGSRRDRLIFRRYLRLRAPPLPARVSSGHGRAQELFLLSFLMHHGRGGQGLGLGLSRTLRRWIRSFLSAFRDGAVGVFCPCWGWDLADMSEEDEADAEEEAEVVDRGKMRRAYLAALIRRGHGHGGTDKHVTVE